MYFLDYLYDVLFCNSHSGQGEVFSLIGQYFYNIKMKFLLVLNNKKKPKRSLYVIMYKRKCKMNPKKKYASWRGER